MSVRARARAWPAAVLSWLARNRLVFATGLAASLPVAVATVKAVSGGWVPLGDAAIIAVRAYDVLTTHPPLVGPYSTSTLLIGHAVQSPGPLLFWLFAVPVRLGAAAPAVWMGLVNICAVIGTVGLARRRGGRPLMFATAAGLALACNSLDARVLYDPWGPSSTLLAFPLLVFLAWSLACGEYRLLPLTVLVASFMVQSHLTYAMPVALLVVIGLGFFVRSGAGLPRRWLVVTLVVLGACWVLPLAEEVVHRPGNVERIVQAATADARRFGASDGFHSVVRAVGIPPWWLRHPLAPFQRVTEVLYGPGAVTTATAVAALIMLAAVAFAGFRRRRRDLAVPALLALGSMAGLFAVTATTPADAPLFVSISYTIWWAAFAGMFAWIALFWAAIVLARARAPSISPRWNYAGVAAVAVIGLLVVLAQKPDRLEGAFDPAGSLVSRIRTSLPPSTTVFVRGDNGEVAVDLQGAIAYGLRAEGIPFVVSSLPGIGHRYDPARHPHTTTLSVTAKPRVGERVIARATLVNVPSDAAPARRTIFVTLVPR